MLKPKPWLLVMVALLMVPFAPALPAGAVPPGDDAFWRVWARTDKPVADLQVSRTWMWGPSAFSATMQEPYAEGPNGLRIVQYFDKSRMEITDPASDPGSLWYVTNGLLVVEMVTGKLQLGDNAFEQRAPAEVNVAGDAGDPSAPTYATFASLVHLPPLPDGALIVQHLQRDGAITERPELGAFGVSAAYYVPETRHRVASPFWDFMNSGGLIYENGLPRLAPLFQDPFYATGFPISEAYWTKVNVGGVQRHVLIQCFERRCLTYTPDNPEGWKVEAGNVGQHYFRWRYDTDIPGEPPLIQNVHDPLGPTPLMLVASDLGGQAAIAFGNQSPYALEVTIEGPVRQVLTLGGCPDCMVYPLDSGRVACREDLEWQGLILPPGNYLIWVRWLEVEVPPLGGYWTLVANADYGGNCFYVVQ